MGKQGIALAVVAIALAAPSQASAAKIDAGDVLNNGLALTADVSLAPYPSSGEGGGYVSCPAGTKIFNGGAFVYPTGGAPSPTTMPFARVNSSTPTSDGAGWYADGKNGSKTAATMRVVLVCLPEAKLTGRTVVVDKVTVGNDETDGLNVRCQQGSRAITGGTFWTPSAGAPDPSTAGDSWVGASTPTGKANGWFGAGRAFAPLDLYAMVHCLPSRQLAPYEKRVVDKPIGQLEDKTLRSRCPKSHPAAGPAGGYVNRPGKGPSVATADDSILAGSGLLSDVGRFHVDGRNIDMPKANLTARAFCLAK